MASSSIEWTELTWNPTTGCDKVTNAGGKSSPNVHLDTEEFGTLRIATDKDYLRNADQNLLYKKFGVRVTGKQNLLNFEMDRNSLKFMELFDYDMEYSDAYLDGLMKRAAPAWEGAPGVSEWLEEVRGGAHA